MSEEELNELRRMMQEEQYEGALRDKMRETNKSFFEVALQLRSMYEANIRAGFNEWQAYGLSVNYMNFLLSSNYNRMPPKR